MASNYLEPEFKASLRNKNRSKEREFLQEYLLKVIEREKQTEELSFRMLQSVENMEQKINTMSIYLEKMQMLQNHLLYQPTNQQEPERDLYKQQATGSMFSATSQYAQEGQFPYINYCQSAGDYSLNSHVNPDSIQRQFLRSTLGSGEHGVQCPIENMNGVIMRMKPNFANTSQPQNIYSGQIIEPSLGQLEHLRRQTFGETTLSNNTLTGSYIAPFTEGIPPKGWTSTTSDEQDSVNATLLSKQQLRPSINAFTISQNASDSRHAIYASGALSQNIMNEAPAMQHGIRDSVDSRNFVVDPNHDPNIGFPIGNQNLFSEPTLSTESINRIANTTSKIDNNPQTMPYSEPLYNQSKVIYESYNNDDGKGDNAFTQNEKALGVFQKSIDSVSLEQNQKLGNDTNVLLQNENEKCRTNSLSQPENEITTRTSVKKNSLEDHHRKKSVRLSVTSIADTRGDILDSIETASNNNVETDIIDSVEAEIDDAETESAEDVENETDKIKYGSPDIAKTESIEKVKTERATVVETDIATVVETEIANGEEPEIAKDAETEKRSNVETGKTSNVETEIVNDVETNIANGVKSKITNDVETEAIKEIEIKTMPAKQNERKNSESVNTSKTKVAQMKPKPIGIPKTEIIDRAKPKAVNKAETDIVDTANRTVNKAKIEIVDTANLSTVSKAKTEEVNKVTSEQNKERKALSHDNRKTCIQHESPKINPSPQDNRKISIQHESPKIKRSPQAVTSKMDSPVDSQRKMKVRRKSKTRKDSVLARKSSLLLSEESSENGVSFADKGSSLTSSAAYKSLIGVAPITSETRKRETTTESESDEDDIAERALAMAMQKNVTETKENSPKKNESPPPKQGTASEPKTSNVQPRKTSLYPAAPQKMKLTKASRIALGLDSESDSAPVQSSIKKKVEEESDEFDFFG